MSRPPPSGSAGSFSSSRAAARRPGGDSRRSRSARSVVLGAASIPRAIAAFPSLASVVHTSYGQTLLVKTAVLVAVLVVAWVNRFRIANLGLGAELALLAGLVVAVAVLTELPPPPRATAAARVVPAVPEPPPAGRGRARGRGRRRRRRARRLPPRGGRRRSRDRARSGRQGHRRADGPDRRIGRPAVRPGLLRGDDPAARAAADRGGRSLRPRREAGRPPLRAAPPLACPRRDRAGHACRPRLPLAAHARHPRAARLECPERDRDRLPGGRAGQARLLDRGRTEGGGHRRHPLGQAPRREVGAVADGADQAAGAVLGAGPAHERPPARSRDGRRPAGSDRLLLRPTPAGLVRARRSRRGRAGCSRCT